MHQRHNENMIFAILTIFEHLGPHQPLLKARHFGFFEIFFWTSLAALAECQSARRTYVSVSTFFLDAVAQKLTELDLAPRRAAVGRCSWV